MEWRSRNTLIIIIIFVVVVVVANFSISLDEIWCAVVTYWSI